MKLLAWAQTDTGLKRDHNEDSLLVDDGARLYAVADGMGGHQGGEHASKLAIEVLQGEINSAADDIDSAVRRLRERTRHDTLSIFEVEAEGTEDVDYFDDEDETMTPMGAGEEPQSPASLLMALAARKASSAVFAAAQGEPLLRGMGTTLTAMLYHGGKMHLCHAGDSRGYLFRAGQLQQLTEDHSWIQEQIKAGIMTEDEAKLSQFRHVITRSVGFERDVEVDSMGIAVEAGDCFLLCSDGLSNYVEGEELARVMASTWYRHLPGVLVDMANQRGGDDNISVVVVYVANDAS